MFFTFGSQVYCQCDVPAGFQVQNAYGQVLGTFIRVGTITDVRGFFNPGTYQVELLILSGGVFVPTGIRQPLIFS
jgi:hypothetical protein